jgi:hypothetical protein
VTAPDAPASPPGPEAGAPQKVAGLAWCALVLGLASLGVLFGADHDLTSGALTRSAPTWAGDNPKAIPSWSPGYTQGPIGLSLALAAAGASCAIWRRRHSTERKTRGVALVGLLICLLALPGAIAFQLHYALITMPLS